MSSEDGSEERQPPSYYSGSSVGGLRIAQQAFCVHMVQTHDRRFTAFVSAMPVHQDELRKDGGRACKECLRLPGYCIDGDPGPAEGSLDDDAIAREEDEDEHDGGSLDSFETFSARVRINNSCNYVDVDEDDAAAAAGGGAEWNKHLPLSPESSQRNIVILRRPKNQWQRSKPDDDDDDCYTTPGGYRSSRATGGAGAGAGTKKRKRESNRGNSDWNHYKRLNKWRRERKDGKRQLDRAVKSTVKSTVKSAVKSAVKSTSATNSTAGATNSTAGFFFLCNSDTAAHCLNQCLFGLPAQWMQIMHDCIAPINSEAVREGYAKPTPLFLYNTDEQELHGVYYAVCKPDYNISCQAWGMMKDRHGAPSSRFPAQVLVKRHVVCTGHLRTQSMPTGKMKPDDVAKCLLMLGLDNYTPPETIDELSESGGSSGGGGGGGGGGGRIQIKTAIAHRPARTSTRTTVPSTGGGDITVKDLDEQLDVYSAADTRVRHSYASPSAAPRYRISAYRD
eukprot:gene4434-10943_t